MLIQCDSCGKKFSSEGMECGDFQEGEIQGKFFLCTKCGKKYIFSVTDEALRAELKEIETEQKKLNTMIRKKFRKETTEKFHENIQRRRKAAFIRSQELKAAFQNGGRNERENRSETD